MSYAGDTILLPILEMKSLLLDEAFSTKYIDQKNLKESFTCPMEGLVSGK